MSGIELVRPSAWIAVEVERRGCSQTEALLTYFDALWEQSMQQAGHTAAIASQPAIGTRVPIGEPPDSLTMLRDVRELLGDPKLDWHDAMKRLRTIQQQ